MKYFVYKCVFFRIMEYDDISKFHDPFDFIIDFHFSFIN